METQVFRRPPWTLLFLVAMTIWFALFTLPLGARFDKNGDPYPAWAFLLPLAGAIIEWIQIARFRLETDESGVRWQRFWGGWNRAGWDEIEVVHYHASQNRQTTRVCFLGYMQEVPVPMGAAQDFFIERLAQQEKVLGWRMGRASDSVFVLLYSLQGWVLLGIIVAVSAGWLPQFGTLDPLFTGLAVLVAIPLTWIYAVEMRQFWRACTQRGQFLLLDKERLIWRAAGGRRAMLVAQISEVRAGRNSFFVRDSEGQQWNCPVAPIGVHFLLRELAARRPDIESLRRYV